MISKEDLVLFLKTNWIVISLFLFSTSLFVYQHYDNLSWDFSTYVLNARYWAGDSQFYETQRAPLMPFVMLLLTPMGVLAEYIYIILASALFLYSSIKLATACKIRKETFYLFSLTPYAMTFGLINGTELLSLALLELFAAALIQRKNYAGFFLGLACLSRYNFLVFLPLMLFDKNVKRIMQNGILFALPFIPWLGYNFIKYGNMFTLIADSYALNFVFRDYIHQTVQFSHFLSLTKYLLPFVIIGMFLVGREWKEYFGKNKIMEFFTHQRISIIVLVIALLSFYQYAQTPIKDVRYIFPLVMSVAYLSAISVDHLMKIDNKISLKMIFFIGVLLCAASLATSNFFGSGEKKDMYVESINVMNSLGIQTCRVMSNEWTVLNYLGRTTEPYPWQQLAGKRITEGYHMVLFYKTSEPDWVRNESFMNQFPILFKNNQFVIMGDADKCLEARTVDWLYIDARNQTNFEVYGEPINTEPCNVMFNDKKVLERFCTLVNFK